ncbi:glycosyltransferase [Bradyrhizobium sp. Tv2a-2]|uniref:glycosyltransferase family 2 protein n=1 Tax=Bradyrhizobium sp. Tv2a-2 TaxID=113395 RepID=UPI000419FD8D|nr:glycosyltransferase [Bradyrhizobium sp. Tv2a-2]
MSIILLLIVAPAALLSIPAVVLFVEVVAAFLPKHGEAPAASLRSKRVGVVVPAHDEGLGLLPTLHDLLGQIRSGDHVLVVADNCSDDTAEVAATAGVEVLVRRDMSRVGKGYALAAGVEYFAADPPDFVVFCDADCRLQADLIDRLVAECERSGRPVQACYLMKQSAKSAGNQSLAKFAWTMKNLVRPLGLRNLGGPCQLMGTGMIFSWQTIRNAPLSSGNLVEDLQLGLDLAERGAPPRFLAAGVTTSEFPSSEKGADDQRRRWVQGYLTTVITHLPRLMVRAVSRADLNLLVLALDLAVPPLVLFAILIVGAWVLASAGVVMGLPATTLVPATGDFLLLTLALALAWLRFGATRSQSRAFSAMGAELWARCFIYLEFLHGRRALQWVRTERSPAAPQTAQLKILTGHSDVAEPN